MVLIINMAVISQDRACVALYFCICAHLSWYMYLLIFAQLCLSLRILTRDSLMLQQLESFLPQPHFWTRNCFLQNLLNSFLSSLCTAAPLRGRGGGGLYSNTGYFFVLCQYWYLALWLQIMVHVQRQNIFLVISILYSFYRYNQFLVIGGDRDGCNFTPCMVTIRGNSTTTKYDTENLYQSTLEVKGIRRGCSFVLVIFLFKGCM